MRTAQQHFRSIFVPAAMAALGVSAAASAHHAFAPEFDASKPIEVRGVVTKLKWVNPHSWIYVDVKAADGTVTNWGFEFGAPGSLRGNGVTKSIFDVGTEVVIKGYLARNGLPQGYTVKAITVADNQEYKIGGEQTPTPQTASATSN